LPNVWKLRGGLDQANPSSGFWTPIACKRALGSRPAQLNGVERLGRGHLVALREKSGLDQGALPARDDKLASWSTGATQATRQRPRGRNGDTREVPRRPRRAERAWLAADRRLAYAEAVRAFLHAAFRRAGLDGPTRDSQVSGSRSSRSRRAHSWLPYFDEYAQPDQVTRRLPRARRCASQRDFGCP
jgi:hypothetical protein